MAFNYDFCVAAALILLVVIIYNYSLGELRTHTKKLYLLLLNLSLLSALADVAEGVLRSCALKDVIWLNILAETVCQSLRNMLPCWYFIYMASIADKMEFWDRKILKWTLPAVAVQLLIVVSPFTGLVFSYDKNGYSRGPLWLVPALAVFFYMLLSMIYVLRKGDAIEKRYKVVSIAFPAIFICAAAVAAIRPSLSLSSFVIAVDFIIMQFAVQNPSLINEANEKEIHARQIAEEANFAKSAFLANMSHEIRTPINAICGMADILERSSLPPHEMEYVQTIQVAAKSLLTIINDILDFSKVAAGKLELCPVEYRMDELLKGVENIVASKLYGKDIEFEINVKAGVPLFLYGDSLKIHQILINILGNAVKFTDKGKIVLSVDWSPLPDDGANIFFKVADTGIGIKKEDISKLFNQFSQVDVMRNRKMEGTGLGLALSKGIANIMNGDVTVVSEYGSGSIFTVNVEQKVTRPVEHDPSAVDDYIVFLYGNGNDNIWQMLRILEQIGVKNVLMDSADDINYEYFAQYSQANKLFMYSYEDFVQPDLGMPDNVKTVAVIEYYTIMRKDASIDMYIRKPYDIFKVYDSLFVNRPDETAKPSDEEVVFDNVRVAVVDDNRVNLKVATTQFMELNILAEAFSNGKAIIRALEKGRRYDVIFMDHMMPEMDGVETTVNIRKMEGSYYKEVPIIALTANAVGGVESEYKAAGMNDWLFKPINLNQLKEKLVQHLPSEKAKIEPRL